MSAKTAFQNSIKLKAAQTIFESQCITEVKVSNRVVGYRATVSGVEIEDTALTKLCRKIVLKLEEK